MEIKHILGITVLLIFTFCFCQATSPRRFYLLFVLYFLPTMDLNVTSESLGSFTIFDTISYFSFFYLIKEFLYSKYTGAYPYLFISLVVIIFFGCILSEFVKVCFYSLVKFISIFIYTKALIDEFFKNPGFIMAVTKGLKFSCFISIVFLFIQIVIGLNFTFYSDLNPNIFDSNQIRYPSFFQDPQVYAQFLSMTSFIFLLRQNNAVTNTYRDLILFFLVMATIFFTGGRSGFLGACMGVVLIIIFSGNKFRLRALVGGLLFYIAISFFSEYVGLFNRQESLGEALAVRDKIWNETFETFLKYPILGIGIDNYRNYTTLHSTVGYYIIDDEIVYYGAESGYLKILVETGLLGLMASLLIILKPVFDGLKAFKELRTNFNIIFIIAGILSWATGFISLYTLSDKRILILLGTLLCLLIHTSKTKSRHEI